MLGDIIRKLRTQRRLTQPELAKSLGVTKQTICNWENNNIVPSVDMLVKLACYFSVSTDYLLELDHRTFIEITELPAEKLTHIQLLIDDLKKQ